MSKYDNVDFIPASQVPRTADYREPTGRTGAVGGGARIGMPQDPGMDLFKNPNAQDEVLGADDLPVYGISALGAMLMQNGQISMREITARDDGEAPIASGLEDRISLTDRYPDGTPGRGEKLEDPYGHRKTAERLITRAENAMASGNPIVARALMEEAVGLLQMAVAADAELSGHDGIGEVRTGFGTAMRSGDPHRGGRR